jgi:NTE family protein
VALALQGGGALGSYRAGVDVAMAASEYLPDWVAGISIGAINAAIIAGNAPPNRVAQPGRFRETATQPALLWTGWVESGVAALPGLRRQLSSAQALLFGQSGFISPQPLARWIQITFRSNDIIRAKGRAQEE